jgi:membrane fusion protein, multidrug efflux system
MATLQREDQGESADERDGKAGVDLERGHSGDRPRNRRVRLIVFAVLILAVIAAIPIYSYYSSRESTDDAQVDGHVVPISSRIDGTILAVLVNDNQVVTAGAQLVKLDPADYQVKFDQAQANVSAAASQMDAAKVNVPLIEINTSSQIKTSSADVMIARAGVESTQRQVDAANARLQSAKAQLAQAQANTARAGVNEALHNVDVAQASILQAKARLNSAYVTERQSRSAAPRQQANSKAQLDSAAAQLKQSQAALEQTKLNLDYTVLRSPVSGLVSRKNAEPGMRVSAGQQLMAIVPLDDVWVTANFKETQLKRMRIGQEVKIKVDAYGGRTYNGHIDSIAAASGARFSLLPPENATGNYVKVVQRVPVKIVLDPGQNQDRLLRPGLSVDPTVLLNSK